MENNHWDELIWFQVPELLKQRFEQARIKAGLSKEQWLEKVLTEFETELIETSNDADEGLAAK